MSFPELRYGLIFIIAWIFVGCRTPQPAEKTPTMAAPARALATLSPESGEVFLPSVGTQTTVTPTIKPSPTVPKAPTALPTTSPEPEYPRYLGPPISRRDFGVQIHLHRENLTDIINQLQDLGVGWVKFQVSWALHEPDPGGYDLFLLGELDALVEAANEVDIKVLLSIAKAPTWSRPVAEMNGPPTDYAHYRDFLTFLAGRYQGRVAAYELWNEPNLQREWHGAPLNAFDFVELVEVGAAGVRAADPSTIIISGAPSPSGINDGVTALDDREYFRDMLAAGVTDVVDAIGAHPYGWANPPDTSLSSPDPAVPSHNDHRSFFFLDTLEDYAALLRQFEADEKPIWVTEFGWGSYDGLGSGAPTGVDFMNDVTEWQQAVYTLRAYELAQQWEWVGPMMVWNLNFGPLLGIGFPETGFSLLRPDGSYRPVFRALQEMPKQ